MRIVFLLVTLVVYVALVLGGPGLSSDDMDTKAAWKSSSKVSVHLGDLAPSDNFPAGEEEAADLSLDEQVPILYSFPLTVLIASVPPVFYKSPCGGDFKNRLFKPPQT